MGQDEIGIEGIIELTKPRRYSDWTNDELRDALDAHRCDLDEWQVTFLEGITEAIASRFPLSDGQRAKAIEIIEHRDAGVDEGEWEDENDWEDPTWDRE